MIDFGIELEGSVALEKRLDQLRANASDLRPAFERIRDDFRRMMERTFSSEGGSNASGKWKPLSPGYAAWKARHYPGKTILRLSDKMRDALTGEGEGAIEEITEGSLTLGADVRSKGGYPYPLAHQEGRGRNPQRKIIDPTPGDIARWMAIMKAHLGYYR